MDGYTYHRDDKPIVRSVEKQIDALKGAEDCIVCSSAMAACNMVCLACLKAGDHPILFHGICGAQNAGGKHEQTAARLQARRKDTDNGGLR